jgi:hypothetical protein
MGTRSQIHESTISLRFLGIILKFSDLRFPYTMFTLQTSCKLLCSGRGGVKSVSKGKTLENFVPITSKNSASLMIQELVSK